MQEASGCPLRGLGGGGRRVLRWHAGGEGPHGAGTGFGVASKYIFLIVVGCWMQQPKKKQWAEDAMRGAL
jgi:hypothetical protein